MEIKINNQLSKIPENCSVGQLLADLFPDSKGIAVAVNQRVLSKSDWERHLLLPSDEVMLIRATQGG